MEDYLTAKEAATEIGIEYSTLLARIRKGKIKCEKHGWAVFIHKDEVKKAREAERETTHAANSSLEKPAR